MICAQSCLLATNFTCLSYLIWLNQQNCVCPGWATFMVFGGIGLASLPADMLRSFFGRPMSIITKSEYIRQARGLAQRAREIKVPAHAWHPEVWVTVLGIDCNPCFAGAGLEPASETPQLEAKLCAWGSMWDAQYMNMCLWLRIATMLQFSQMVRWHVLGTSRAAGDSTACLAQIVLLLAAIASLLLGWNLWSRCPLCHSNSGRKETNMETTLSSWSDSFGSHCHCQSLGEELRKEERANGRTRRWRKHFKAVNRELVLLEDDELELEKKFPQVKSSMGPLHCIWYGFWKVFLWCPLPT